MPWGVLMSRKRDLIAALLPRGVPFSESLNDNARFVSMRRERFSACPEFATREALYEAIAPADAITYLEFGVWRGESIKRWCTLNTHVDSRFYGFDTFEGLPEDWDPAHPKGTFSTSGATPMIDDGRVSFVKGLFQDTLRDFLKRTPLSHRLVVNVDCDIYSATLFVMGTLDRYFAPGTIVVFDDFYSMSHEFRAFHDYDRSFGRTWRAIARMPHCIKAAIEIEK
jgi:hypothetical protein